MTVHRITKARIMGEDPFPHSSQWAWASEDLLAMTVTDTFETTNDMCPYSVVGRNDSFLQCFSTPGVDLLLHPVVTDFEFLHRHWNDPSASRRNLV
eukprot:scaffold10690_cov126-Cylindrotheca_fusiformis.AAC.2